MQKIRQIVCHSFAIQLHGWLRILWASCFALVSMALSVAQAQTTNYTLGTAALLVGPAAGTNSVVLAVKPTSGGWTATANTNWLHLDTADQSGTGSTNVIFTYDANSGPTRSGTFTIGNQTLTVTQAGSTYAAARQITTLVVSDAPNDPGGLAVDGTGNVFFAESFSNTIREWRLASNTTITLVSSGLDEPGGMAMDAAGNVYFVDSLHGAVKEWSPVSNNVTTVLALAPNSDPTDVAVYGNQLYVAVASGSEVLDWTIGSRRPPLTVANGDVPVGVKLDAAGNIYVVNFFGNNVQKTAVDGGTVTLVSEGLKNPEGVAVDGAGNVYVADAAIGVIDEWSAVNGNVTTLVSNLFPDYVAVDGAGNIYFGNGGTNELLELPYAFVDPTPKLEGLSAGSDSLPSVLPTTENLLPPFAPTSDQSWLTITGITNDVVSFSFTSNTGPARTANITLLGQTIPITQGTIGTPSILTGAQTLGNGVLQFGFTNTESASLTVLSTTNVALPLSNWTVVGTALNIGPGQYQFISQPTTNDSQRFYTVRSP